MIGRQAIAKKLLGTEAFDKLTAVIAQVENELLQAAIRLEEATGERRIGDPPSVDARKEALKGLIEAIVTDSFEDVWLEEVAPTFVDKPEKVEQYLGMDADAWESQIERWGETYRNAGAEGSDRALADAHVQDQFGVDLAEFEQRVIEFNPGAEAERLFAANFRAVRQTIDRVAEEQRDADAGGTEE